MSVHAFRSFSNIPIIREPSPSERAADLALEVIERYKDLRDEAKQRELACEPPLEWSGAAQECVDTLEALMKGVHRHVVLQVMFEHLPEMVIKGEAAPPGTVAPS